MRHQDWNAVVETHIRAAGGDPRFVLKSMDEELEKVAAWLGVGARMLGSVAGAAGRVGSGAAGLARRTAGWVGGLGTGAANAVGGWGKSLASTGRGLQLEYAAGKGGFKFAPGVVDKLRGSSAATGTFRNLDAAKQARLAGKWGDQGVAMAFKPEGLAAAEAAAKKAAQPVSRFISGAERSAAKAAAPGLPAAAPAVAPAVDPARLAAGSSQTAAGAVNPAVAENMGKSLAAGQTYNAGMQASVATKAAATPTDIAGAPLWDQGKAIWKGWTPGQQMGAVAGAAAVPALGAGLMMGGGGQRGNTTIIQR